MAVLEARYVCDRCGMKANFIPRVFHDEKCYQERLCEPCLGLFKEEYKLWCNNPKPEPPKPKKAFSILFG